MKQYFFCLCHSKVTHVWIRCLRLKSKTPLDVSILGNTCGHPFFFFICGALNRHIPEDRVQLRGDATRWWCDELARIGSTTDSSFRNQGTRGVLAVTRFFFYLKTQRVLVIVKGKPFSAQLVGEREEFSPPPNPAAEYQAPRLSPPSHPFHSNLLWHVWADLSSNCARIPHVLLYGWYPNGTKKRKSLNCRFLWKEYI